MYYVLQLDPVLFYLYRTEVGYSEVFFLQVNPWVSNIDVSLKPDLSHRYIKSKSGTRRVYGKNTH